ncbi:MAG: hypothetical protein ACXVAC_16165 [Vulcanimicrobiaceae bacterium]
MLKRIASLCALIACVALGAAPAGATGTITIRQNDGRVNAYNDVTINVIHGALFLTSEDGKGTLVIHRAACSYQGKLLTCFATSATLIQAGQTNPLDLKTGTVYLNSTDAPQPLVLSTAKVPAHSILLSLTTYRGTYVNLNGRIDKVVK